MVKARNEMRGFDKESRLKQLKRQRVIRFLAIQVCGLMFLLILGTAGEANVTGVITLGMIIRILAYFLIMIICAWFAGGFDYLKKGDIRDD